MDANVVVTQVTSAAMVVWAIQKLKAATWFPWLQNGGQVWAKRILSALAALATHTGISYVWNAGNAGVGDLGTLVITVPMLSTIFIGLWHWANQFVLQELIYQGVANKTPTLAVPPPAAPAPAAAPAAGS